MAATAQHAVGNETLTAGDIAGVMRCSDDSVRRHHEEWSRTLGFPAAVSVPGVRGLRWSRLAVAEWQLQQASRDYSSPSSTEIDWAEIAAIRGALLDAGLDPDRLPASR